MTIRQPFGSEWSIRFPVSDCPLILVFAVLLSSMTTVGGRGREYSGIRRGGTRGDGK